MLKKISKKNRVIIKTKTLLKEGDVVLVLSGKDKGKTGTIKDINRKDSKVIIEGINLIKKSKKRIDENNPGGILTIEAPMDISNIMFYKNNIKTKLSFSTRDLKRIRISKKTGEIV